MSVSNPVPLDLRSLSLAEIARLARDQKLPPVDRWNPEHCGHSGMRILRDGSWLHDGSPITRPEMVRLFASILRREPAGGFVLVTPVEKLDIDVDDAPFVAVEVKSEGEGKDRKLAFRLNIEEIVVAGFAHPLRVEAQADGPHPYLQARSGLDALIARSVYYELAEMAIAEGADPLGLWSDGIFLPLDAA